MRFLHELFYSLDNLGVLCGKVLRFHLVLVQVIKTSIAPSLDPILSPSLHGLYSHWAIHDPHRFRDWGPRTQHAASSTEDKEKRRIGISTNKVEGKVG
jgi:hypothetical protein